MPMSRRRVEVAVGGLVLTGLVAMLLSVIFIGEQQGAFQRRMQLYTEFDSVEGLQEGAPVQLAGIPAGSVDRVALTDDGHVRVQMRIRESLFGRIHQDSVARIKSAGLVGDRYIDITVGSTDSPPVEEEAVIQGFDPLDWAQALDEVRPVLDNLAIAIENMRVVAMRLADEDSDVGTTLNNLREITTTLREGRGTFGRLLVDEEVYEDLRAAVASGRQAAADAEVVAGVLRDDAPALVEEAGKAMAQFGDAAATVQEGFNDLPELMAGLRRASNDLETAMANVRAISEDLRVASPQVPELLTSGQAAVDEARAVLDAARAHPILRRYFEGPAPEEPILVQDRAGVADAS